MQRCSITLRLSGDPGNTIYKNEVTPAEIVLLRAIHGADAVIDVKPTHMCKTPHREERQRLSLIYGKKRLDATFPGDFTKLPVSLKDIELTKEEAEDERPVKGGGQQPVPLPTFDAGMSDEAEDAAEAAQELEDA